ncbi:sensor histidine kinase [Cohnella sp. CIP 111063]|jgi:NarL family two-component system sensor histidine kinase LiaS|uniref:sensor histidine kinase n=1 Tax=unclassified Cohnella TaxID=2636738 RepID=UPI000B8BB841|nr:MULTISPECIES: sensor histidine kinase [unclassified Cohnella]OXS54005.1 sensor histidine kinase [Cohnella sp. CIP 111063]PRX62878.1 two-component system, NarL family, sensor histidine kinase LiaS [Cohnella sp. SGD-V74]
MESRKVTNMVWRHMGEAVLYSLGVGALVVYLLIRYGVDGSFHSLNKAISFSLTAIGVLSVAGAAFGFWRSFPIRNRLEMLRESMVTLEKGTPSLPLPDLGKDEIGRLGEQLGKLGRKWEDQVSSLQRLSTNNAELAAQARMSAVVEERQRLARELHDAVSQQLFAISMTATAVGRTMDHDFERARRQVELIEEMASAAQSEMRALLLHLRPVHLEGKRLAQAIPELVEEMKAKVPVDIAIDIEQDLPLNKGVENHLFRIVQEALSNTLRHSKATKMDIVLQRRGEAVRLGIRDNGIGFDTQVKKQASYGMTNMEERVNELGGSLNVASAPGKGTRIEIRVPLMAEGG